MKDGVLCGSLRLDDGSKHHRAVEGRADVGRKLDLGEAQGFVELDGGDVGLDAGRDVLHGALDGHLVDDLVHHATHGHASGRAVELDKNLGLDDGVGCHGLEVHVCGGVSEEVALYVLDEAELLLTFDVEFHKDAVRVKLGKQGADVRSLDLHVDGGGKSGAIDDAGHEALGAEGVELAGADSFTLRSGEGILSHDGNITELEMMVCGSSSDVGARAALLQPRRPPGCSRACSETNAVPQDATFFHLSQAFLDTQWRFL